MGHGYERVMLSPKIWVFIHLLQKLLLKDSEKFLEILSLY